jgi:hypothetical protein
LGAVILGAMLFITSSILGGIASCVVSSLQDGNAWRDCVHHFTSSHLMRDLGFSAEFLHRLGKRTSSRRIFLTGFCSSQPRS